jgi:MerR family copper efflux transcriptional regulator
MKIKEVMQQTGLPENTIRYYESRGLITPETQRRNGRTYHEYSREDVEALGKILTLRRARFSIEEILLLQRQPEHLPEVVTQVQGRIQREQQELSLLTEDRSWREATDWKELSQYVEASLTQVPDYTPTMNFAQFNEETPEEIQAAIAAHQSRTEGRFWSLRLCICLVVVLVLALIGSNLYLLHDKLQQTQVVTFSTETTEDWLYYEYNENVYRSRWDGSEKETVYQHKNTIGSFQYIVDTNKLYILDGTALYSCDPDGSNVHQYEPEFGSAFTNAEEGLSVFRLYDGALYVGQHKGGTFGSTNCGLTRVPVDGSPQTKLKLNVTDWTCCCGQIWDGKLYLYGYVNDQYTDVGTLSMPVACIYDLESDTTVWDYEGEPTYCIRYGLFFGDDYGYLFTEMNYSDAPEEEDHELIRVSPEDPAGTVIGTIPGQARTANENYAIYVAYNSDGIGSLWLENLETGATLALGDSEDLGHIEIDYQFTEKGLIKVTGPEEWTLVKYP